jgi:hypothetical protein
MRVRFVRPGDMARAIFSHLPNFQHFAGEVIPALPETSAAERRRRRTGERP